MIGFLETHLQTIGVVGIMALGLVIAHDIAATMLSIFASWLAGCP